MADVTVRLIRWTPLIGKHQRWAEQPKPRADNQGEEDEEQGAHGNPWQLRELNF
jgi:hypothetical protein